MQVIDERAGMREAVVAALTRRLPRLASGGGGDPRHFRVLQLRFERAAFVSVGPPLCRCGSVRLRRPPAPALSRVWGNACACFVRLRQLRLPHASAPRAVCLL